jgi:Amt family ammonium transporter
MRLLSKLSWLALAVVAAAPALAQDAEPSLAEAAETTAEVVSNLSAGDTAWMLTSSLLVLFMILPGLALFYGGLVRVKNMLSVLMQCTIITAMVMVLYVLYGYSMSFGGSESAYWGGLGKMFLAGVTPDSESGTIPELVFVAFQMTFACITPALIVGGFAERMKFSAVVLFVLLWVTIVEQPPRYKSMILRLCGVCIPSVRTLT